ncbi:MAG: hypothetical protein [Microviridae sp.]|nr:MAG: hypothetical protein [Microviridae sp.]
MLIRIGERKKDRALETTGQRGLHLKINPRADSSRFINAAHVATLAGDLEHIAKRPIGRELNAALTRRSLGLGIPRIAWKTTSHDALRELKKAPRTSRGRTQGAECGAEEKTGERRTPPPTRRRALERRTAERSKTHMAAILA